MKFGETADAAIIREYEEETNSDLQIDKLMTVIENFFDLDRYLWRQYIFSYQLKDNNSVNKLYPIK